MSVLHGIAWCKIVMLKDLDEFPMTDGVAVATCLSHKQCDQDTVSPSLQSAISFCIPTVLGESRRSKFKPLTGIVREFDFMYACLVALFWVLAGAERSFFLLWPFPCSSLTGSLQCDM